MARKRSPHAPGLHPDPSRLRVCDRERDPDARGLAPPVALPPHRDEIGALRVRHARPGRRARALIGQVLPGRDDVHHLRHRDGIHDPVGGGVPADGRHGGPAHRGDARVHPHPRGGVRVYLEAGSPGMGLTDPTLAADDFSTQISAASQNFITTRLDFLSNWSRANSLWPMPFGTACCAIEYMATAASRFDISRFGMERQAFSPRQADVFICAGRVPFKLAPVMRRIWDQMAQPKWCISMGACASSGGIFDNYTIVQGIDTIIPVDVYVPGCPPRPEGLLYGIQLLQKKIRGESFTDESLRDEKLVGPSGLFLPPERVDELSEPFGNSVHQTRSA